MVGEGVRNRRLQFHAEKKLSGKNSVNSLKSLISPFFDGFYHYWVQGKGTEVMDWSICGWGMRNG